MSKKSFTNSVKASLAILILITAICLFVLLLPTIESYVDEENPQHGQFIDKFQQLNSNQTFHIKLYVFNASLDKNVTSFEKIGPYCYIETRRIGNIHTRTGHKGSKILLDEIREFHFDHVNSNGSDSDVFWSYDLNDGKNTDISSYQVKDFLFGTNMNGNTHLGLFSNGSIYYETHFIPNENDGRQKTKMYGKLRNGTLREGFGARLSEGDILTLVESGEIKPEFKSYSFEDLLENGAFRYEMTRGSSFTKHWNGQLYEQSNLTVDPETGIILSFTTKEHYIAIAQETMPGDSSELIGWPVMYLEKELWK